MGRLRPRSGPVRPRGAGRDDPRPSPVGSLRDQGGRGRPAFGPEVARRLSGRPVPHASGQSRRAYELWDLERGEVPAAWLVDARAVAHRADGRQVAALRSDGELRVYDLPALTESARARLGFDVDRLTDDRMALSGDGRRLACVRSGWSGVDVFDTASGRLVRAVSRPNVTDRRPDGAGSHRHPPGLRQRPGDRDLRRGRAARSLAQLQEQHDGAFTARFQPRGRLLATAGRDSETRLWDPIRGRPTRHPSGRVSAMAAGMDRAWRSSRIGTSRVTGWRGDSSGGRSTAGCSAIVPAADAPGPARVAYSPDGRLIALPFRPDGVRIVRASDGRALARLPIGDCDEALFLPDGGLMTYNGRGLCRWPIRHVSVGDLRGWARPSRWRLLEGAGKLVASGLAAAPDGHVVGVSDQSSRPGAVLLDPDRPWRRTWLVPHWGVVQIAISPDGRWAATGCQVPSSIRPLVKVWDAADGALVAQARARQRPRRLQPRRAMARRRRLGPLPILPDRLLGPRPRGRARRGGRPDGPGIPSRRLGRRDPG